MAPAVAGDWSASSKEPPRLRSVYRQKFCRAALDAVQEDDLRDQVLKANEEIDEAIIQTEALMKAHGITLSVTDTPNCLSPLCNTAEIISPLTNRCIQLIEIVRTSSEHCVRWLLRRLFCNSC